MLIDLSGGVQKIMLHDLDLFLLAECKNIYMRGYEIDDDLMQVAWYYRLHHMDSWPRFMHVQADLMS